MLKKIIKIMFFGLLAVGLFACTSMGANMGKGKKMTLEFNTNPTTGFDWYYEEAGGDDVGRLNLISDDYESKAVEGVVGAGGVRRFVFEAVKAGKQAVTFTYKRNWEGGETAYDVVYELDIDNDLNISCLSKSKGSIESDVELSSFPNPIFEK